MIYCSSCDMEVTDDYYFEIDEPLEPVRDVCEFCLMDFTEDFKFTGNRTGSVTINRKQVPERDYSDDIHDFIEGDSLYDI